MSQVRGYADQRLRKPDDPEDPSNRRISMIVQYLVKKTDDDDNPEAESGKTGEHGKPEAEQTGVEQIKISATKGGQPAEKH